MDVALRYFLFAGVLQRFTKKKKRKSLKINRLKLNCFLIIFFLVFLYLFTAVRVVWNKMHKGKILIFIWEYFIVLN